MFAKAGEVCAEGKQLFPGLWLNQLNKVFLVRKAGWPTCQHPHRPPMSFPSLHSLCPQIELGKQLFLIRGDMLPLITTDYLRPILPCVQEGRQLPVQSTISHNVLIPWTLQTFPGETCHPHQIVPVRTPPPWNLDPIEPWHHDFVLGPPGWYRSPSNGLFNCYCRGGWGGLIGFSIWGFLSVSHPESPSVGQLYKFS